MLNFCYTDKNSKLDWLCLESVYGHSLVLAIVLQNGFLKNGQLCIVKCLVTTQSIYKTNSGNQLSHTCGFDGMSAVASYMQRNDIATNNAKKLAKT